MLYEVAVFLRLYSRGRFADAFARDTSSTRGRRQSRIRRDAKIFFLVAAITAVLVTVVSVDAIATFAVVVFAILMVTSPISASMGSDIQIITRTITHTPISNYGAY